MAKFAEFTHAREGDLHLVNPDHVHTFWRCTDGGTAISFGQGRPWLVVKEAPDEVLRRLCFPEMPDPPEAPRATLADELREAARKIGAFRVTCEEGDYTDTGEAWGLLDEIEDIIKTHGA